MPAPSKVALLPEDIREEFERRLVASGFSGYEAHSAWLATTGHPIGKSALGEFGKNYKKRLEQLRIAAEQAKALRQAAPDDEGAVNDMVIRMAQEKIFNLLMELDIDPEKVNVSALFRSIAEVTRATTSHKRFMEEFQKKGSGVIEEMAKSTGMSEEQANLWKMKFLGVTA